MIKRLYILTILLCSIFGAINAQVETHYYKKGETPNLRKSISKSVPTKQMPAFDVEKVKKEHAEIDEKTGLCHFGKGIEVSYTLADGIWEETDGGRLWTMAFESNGALSLNFVFEDFYLPEGAELYLTNEDESIVFGPVTSEALHENGHFLTDIVSGSRAKISLYEPFECIGQSALTIKRVVHGYRNWAATYSANSETHTQRTYYAGSPDVACYPDYDDVSDGVGLLFTSDGEADVSCSLVMTTDYSFKPYILTTYFFIDHDSIRTISNQEIGEAENCMVKFRCKYTTCGGNIPVTSYTYNQSYFRAAYRYGGMGLLELRSTLKDNPNLTWLGWNCSLFPSLAKGATLFHSDDQKLRIALCECYASTLPFSGINCTKITHYLGYPSGYSSGTPFLNQSLQVSAITIKTFDGVYENGMECNWSLIRPLIESWGGGLTDSTGLVHWLNPEGKNWLSMPASRVIKIVGPNFISDSGSYYVQNLPSDMTVTWSLSDNYYNQHCLQQNYPTSNQCTITRSSVQEMSYATLTATLKRNNTTMCTFTQTVSTYGFNGTYFNGVSTQQINLPYPLFVLPGITARITSPDLIGATVTVAGGNLTPNYMSFNNTHDELYIGIPSSPSGTILLGASFSNGSYCTIPIINTLTNNQLSVIPMANQLEVSLTRSSVLEDNVNSQSAGKMTDSINPDEWNLDVYNVQTGDRVASAVVSGSTYTLDTSNWNSGVYVVRAKIGKELLCEKVSVK